ncbi:MAG: NAD(P)-dependent oxidoreductase [Bacteroidota bacterium]|nr:NAD(P)-dependent oxidoreductase [Bacteroidota bacterium]
MSWFNHIHSGQKKSDSKQANRKISHKSAIKIAVTGGSGFVGRAVIEMGLKQGHTFVNIDRSPPENGSTIAKVPFIKTDITDYDALKKALHGCEALIHLAAINKPFSHPDHEVHNTNVVGSYNAMRAAIDLGITRICLASSVNAIGHVFSHSAKYNYFPINEHHPTYADDPYGLSKWICEQQAESLSRRYKNLSIASLRFHWIVKDRSIPQRAYANPKEAAANLTGYTLLDASARACLLFITAHFQGHEVFFIIAPNTAVDNPSIELARVHYPDVPIRSNFSGNCSFFDSSKAEKILGWSHHS